MLIAELQKLCNNLRLLTAITMVAIRGCLPMSVMLVILIRPCTLQSGYAQKSSDHVPLSFVFDFSSTAFVASRANLG